MMQKETMSLVNADKGLWSRKQGTEKSIIDYVMTNTEYLSNIKEMIITDHLQNQDLKKKYFDHNVIILKINFSTETIQQKNAK